MKKYFLLTIIIIIVFLTGCTYQQEFYNDKDKSDFGDSASVKFDIIQFKNVIDEKTLKEFNLNGAFFMFMGGVSAKSKEETMVTNYYYAYLKNKNNGVYFSKIPIDKVRIYEDAETPCIVCYKTAFLSQGGKYDYYINVNDEDKWDDYEKFNLHIPKGTIIPRVNFDFDINNFK